MLTEGRQFENVLHSGFKKLTNFNTLLLITIPL